MKWKKTTYTSSPTCHQILLARITCDIVMRTRYPTLQMMSGIPLVKWTDTTTSTPYNKAHFTFQNKSALKESNMGEGPVWHYPWIYGARLFPWFTCCATERSRSVPITEKWSCVSPFMVQRTHASESCAAAVPRDCVRFTHPLTALSFNNAREMMPRVHPLWDPAIPKTKRFWFLSFWLWSPLFCQLPSRRHIWRSDFDALPNRPWIQDEVHIIILRWSSFAGLVCTEGNVITKS